MTLGTVCTVLANSAVNVLLPLIAAALDVDAARSVWVVHAHLLAGAIGLLPAAALGDRYGPGRVFRLSLVLFCVASVACALAPMTRWPFAALLVARFAQGLGAAGVMAVSMALVRAIHPVASIGRFIGLNAMAVAASHAAGPVVGGSLAGALSWQAVLGVLALPGVISLALAARALPDGAATAGRRINAVAVLLQAGAIVSLLAAPGAGPPGWRVALGLAGAALAVAFVRHERRHGYPLLPLDLLARPLFAVSFCCAVACFVAQMAALVALPFLLHGVGLGLAETGWVMAPWPLAAMFTSPVAGALSDRLSTTPLMAGGLAIAGTALMAAAWLAGHAPVGMLALCMAIAGVGFALFTGPNARTLATSAPADRVGAVGGMHAMSRQAGQLLGSGLAAFLLGTAAGPRAALGAAAAAACLAALAVSLRPRSSAV